MFRLFYLTIFFFGNLLALFLFFRHILISVFSIFFFLSYLLQISFYIYLLLSPLIFVYRFYIDLSLYLVSRLCFFNGMSCHPFLYMIKKNYKSLILSIRLELFIMLIASSLLIYQK